MPFRFVHTADIHLDSPLRSLALRAPELAEIIGNATRQAFVRTIDLCLEEGVDALLIAGDLYDSEQTSMKTARFLGEQLHRLHAAGIGSFIIRGNHDAESRITRELLFPASVHVFDHRGTPQPLTRAAHDMPVTVHGVSFSQPRAPASLLDRFRPPVDGSLNIALMHTSLDGTPEHDVYAPCAATDLRRHGFDYWALGHIHRRSVIHAGCAIVMPGMPQGRDIGESGPKSVTLVTVRDDRSIELQERATCIAQFERAEIDLSGIEAWPEALDALLRGIQRVREEVVAEHAIIRPCLAGTTPLAWRARRDRDLLLERADMAFPAKVWIDKIEIACRPPRQTGPAADPVSELQRLIAGPVVKSPAYRREVEELAEELRRQIPAAARGFLGHDADALHRLLDSVIAEGTEDVLSQLRPGSDG